jgi:MFS family permease
MRLRVAVAPAAGGTTVTFEAGSDLRVPYWQPFVVALAHVEARRQLRQAAATLAATLDGRPAPRAPRSLPLLPPVPFTDEQARRLGAIAAVAAAASFCGALLTQNGDAAVDAFRGSDGSLGVALAIARAGAVVSLVTASMSDRFGRRRVLLLCLVGAAAANAVSAAAPTFAVFTGGQLMTRAFTNAVLAIAGIAAVEEAPEGARAFALSIFALAFGIGFSLSVVLLPFADLGREGWRIAFALSALSVALVPGLRRHLHETARYRRLRTATWRPSQMFREQYGRRFLLLGSAAFLANLFSAPSSQLTNRYLHRTHDFSNSDVALFRTITLGLPGVIGIVAAGRLAESRGRRSVALLGMVVATFFQAAFFLTDGVFLWVAPVIGIVAAASTGVALGTLDAELFPTESRGTSGGFLVFCGIAGAAVGLLLATSLRGVAGGLGPAIALCVLAPLVAAVFVVPRLPETARRTLDEISPSAD